MREPRVVPSPIDEGGTPWGLWATVGFGVLIMALWIVVQIIATVSLVGTGAKGSNAMAQGWVLGWTTIISAPFVVGAPVLLARVRKGISVAAYLGLAWPGARQALRWSVVLLGFLVASDLLSLALGRPVVPESMISMYQTAGSLPMFLSALVVAAPLAEEFLFRGFLFAGLRNSRLGPPGAIALTALAWAALHMQYDVYGMATIAATGVLLGSIRWRTGSLWLCALLHGLMNAVASAEVMFILSRR